MPWSAEMARRKAPLGERLKQAWRVLRGQTAVAEIVTDPYSEIEIERTVRDLERISAEWWCQENAIDLAKRSIAGQFAREAEKRVSFTVIPDVLEDDRHECIVRGELYISKPEEGT